MTGGKLHTRKYHDRPTQALARKMRNETPIMGPVPRSDKNPVMPACSSVTPRSALRSKSCEGSGTCTCVHTR